MRTAFGDADTAKASAATAATPLSRRSAAKMAAACGGEVCPAFPAASFGTHSSHLERADRLSTPHPLASFCDPVILTGAWRTVPKKIYVRATGWPGYEQLGFRSYASIKADNDWDKIDVPCGHDIMLDEPDVLADILANVA